MSKKKVFSKEYFLLQLENTGAIKDTKNKKVSQRSLVKVTNISIGLVLAAFALDEFPDQEVIKWIRKGRKLTDILSEQFNLYKNLSKYLMNDVKLKGKCIEKWKTILNLPYVWPTKGEQNDWCKLFGYVPDFCEDMVDILKIGYTTSCDESVSPSQMKELEQVAMSCLEVDVKSKTPTTTKRKIEATSDFSKKQHLNSEEKEKALQKNEGMLKHRLSTTLNQGSNAITAKSDTSENSEIQSCVRVKNMQVEEESPQMIIMEKESINETQCTELLNYEQESFSTNKRKQHEDIDTKVR
ncbi:unnamed protein product, partial [Meganyctiphanes norvegica]